MKVLRINHNSKAVKELLKSKVVEDFLAEEAEKIAAKARNSLKHPADIRTERVPDRKNRAAVDVTAERTWEVMRKHVLEKAVEL